MADFIDEPNVNAIFIPAAGSLAVFLSPASLNAVFAPAANSLAVFLSPSSLTIKFRPDITNGLLFSEVLAAVWNEAAFVLLNPELLLGVWSEEAVVSDAMFGFPGVSLRIQTVDVDIELQ